MASAGHAHAHSSQPTHFSRPSGCLLRTCRPWNRGIVVFFCSGYNSVLTDLNMVANVTPNPLTGPKKLLIGASGAIVAIVRGQDCARRPGTDAHRTSRRK